MKKRILAAAATVLLAVSGFAADLSTVWNQIAANGTFIVGDAPKKGGFEKLEVALNTAPTSQQINDIKRLVATIDSNQKVTSVSQQGVDVSIFVAPADADLTLYKVMFVVDKNDNEDKALLVLYGTCTREALSDAIRDISLEDIIGG